MIFDLPALNNPKANSKGLKFRVFFAPIEDVDIDNFPRAVNATIRTNPLKAGKVWHYFDSKMSSFKPSAAVGDSPAEGKLTATAIVDGIAPATLAWIYALAGKNVILIWERCSDGARFIGGSPCSGGLTVKYTSIGDQDGGTSGIALSFEGGECAEPFLFYEGELPLEEPTIVSSSTLTIGVNSRYIIGDNGSAITDIAGLASGDVGRVIEIVGGGVSSPVTISNSEKFILADQVDFVASVGSSIFFVVTQIGSEYTLTELLRR